MANFNKTIDQIIEKYTSTPESKLLTEQLFWGGFNLNKQIYLKTGKNIFPSIKNPQSKEGKEITDAYNKFTVYIEKLIRQHAGNPPTPSPNVQDLLSTRNESFSTAVGIYENIHRLGSHNRSKKQIYTDLYSDIVTKVNPRTVNFKRHFLELHLSILNKPGDTITVQSDDREVNKKLRSNEFYFRFDSDNYNKRAELIDQIQSRLIYTKDDPSSDELSTSGEPIDFLGHVIDPSTGIIQVAPSSDRDILALLTKNINHVPTQQELLNIANKYGIDTSHVQQNTRASSSMIRSHVEVNPFDENGNIPNENLIYFFNAVYVYVRSLARNNNNGFLIQNFVDSCFEANSPDTSEGSYRQSIRRKEPAINTTTYRPVKSNIPRNIEITAYNTAYNLLKKYFSNYLIYMTAEQKARYDKDILTQTASGISKVSKGASKILNFVRDA